MERKPAPIIGLVGGIGSGKSAVARWLVEHFGGYLIDADRVGHQVLLQEDVKQELHQAFGPSIFENGQVDRRRLAALVFGNMPEQNAARKTLERIVHPVMEQQIRDEIASVRQNERVELIVLDAAILLESGWRDTCDVVAFVDVPRDVRLRRVAESRGWSEDDLSSREASQWPLARKREASDVVIHNSGPVEQAGRQLAQFLTNEGWLDPPGECPDPLINVFPESPTKMCS